MRLRSERRSPSPSGAVDERDAGTRAIHRRRAPARPTCGMGARRQHARRGDNGSNHRPSTIGGRPELLRAHGTASVPQREVPLTQARTLSMTFLSAARYDPSLRHNDEPCSTVGVTAKQRVGHSQNRGHGCALRVGAGARKDDRLAAGSDELTAMAAKVSYVISPEHKDYVTAAGVGRLRSDATPCPRGLNLTTSRTGCGRPSSEAT